MESMFERITDFLLLYGLPIGLILVVHGTITRSGSFGVNLGSGPIHCGNCNQRLNAFRVPDGLNEAMFGGGTCPKCGKKLDKWGKVRKQV